MRIPVLLAPRRWWMVLERLNVALSLVVGVEYPAAGIQRSSLEQAHETLGQILANGLLDEEHGWKSS